MNKGFMPGNGVRVMGMVLLVNTVRSWPAVVAGRRSAASAVLGEWGQLPNDEVVADVEVVCGVFEDRIVAVFDVDGWDRLENGRVVFEGRPSSRWAHLVGSPAPGWSFRRRGVARPVQPLPMSELEGEPAEPVEGGSRAVVGGYTLTVVDGRATVTLPPGGQVTVAA